MIRRIWPDLPGDLIHVRQHSYCRLFVPVAPGKWLARKLVGKRRNVIIDTKQINNLSSPHHNRKRK